MPPCTASEVFNRWRIYINGNRLQCDRSSAVEKSERVHRDENNCAPERWTLRRLILNSSWGEHKKKSVKILCWSYFVAVEIIYISWRSVQRLSRWTSALLHSDNYKKKKNKKNGEHITQTRREYRVNIFPGLMFNEINRYVTSASVHEVDSISLWHETLRLEWRICEKIHQTATQTQRGGGRSARHDLAFCWIIK